MQKYKTPVIFLSLLVVLFVCINFFGTSILRDILGVSDTALSDDVDTSILDKQLPSFDLRTVSGDRLRSHTLIGKPSVLLFWATWSRESADQLKILDDYFLHNPTQAQLVTVVAVNSQEDPSVASSFIKRGGYQSVVAMDSFGEATLMYKVKSLPTFYFIDSDGLIRDVYRGPLSEQNLVKKVEKLFSDPGV